jgi:NhaP-type Na+/H+ and K+/H+ antiporter
LIGIDRGRRQIIYSLMDRQRIWAAAVVLAVYLAGMVIGNSRIVFHRGIPTPQLGWDRS